MDQIAAITTGPGSLVETAVAEAAPAVVFAAASSLPAITLRMSAILNSSMAQGAMLIVLDGV